ncbi:MAG: hypothetical protein H0T69_05455 [Thermoleophilaceae bacterium]|nr:hypothetical protein [Thermoleophilaceae bacterium]
MATAPPEQETALMTALKAGDDAVFMAIFRAWGPGAGRVPRLEARSGLSPR